MSAPTVFIIAHSHFDPEWIRTYRAYLRQEFRHMRRRLELLRRDASHKFCPPEEVATLPFLHQCSAAHRRIFRDGVRQRLIEPKGSVAAGELSMHSGEAIARQFVLGRFLLERELGFALHLSVAQSIDNYALCQQFPQILRQCGRDRLIVGVYRTKEHGTLHISTPPTDRLEQWWQGPDGSRVLLVLSVPNYNGIDAEPTMDESLRLVKVVQRHASPRAMFLFSGGDMAAPDPQLPAKLCQWSRHSGIPMRVALPREYFHALRRDKTIPVTRADSVTDHLGAFESRVEARQTSRRAETALLTAEKLATAAWTMGCRYPAEPLQQAWFELLINHNHDAALACLPDSLMRHVMERHRRVQQAADEIIHRSLRHVSAKIDTRCRTGQAVLVFNPLNWTRTDIVSLAVDVRDPIRVVDHRGEKCGSHLHTSGRSKYLSFIADRIPPLGIKLFFIEPCGLAEGPVELANQRELAFSLVVERDEGCANMIRVRGDRTQELHLLSARQFAWGSLGICQEHRYRFGRSDLVQRAVRYPHLNRMDVTLTTRWRDAGHRLRVSVPLPSRTAMQFFCHEPFLAGRRDPHEATARKPVLYWAGAICPATHSGIAVANRGTHSCAVENASLRMTLMRSVDWNRVAADSDGARDRDCGWCFLDHANLMASEMGKRRFEFAILPIDDSIENSRVHQRAYEFNHPLCAAMATRHRGSLPAEHSFVNLDDQRVIISAWKKSYRERHSVLRLYEPFGRDVSDVSVRLARGKFTGGCNLDEKPMRAFRKPKQSIRLRVGAHRIRSLLIEGKNQ